MEPKPRWLKVPVPSLAEFRATADLIESLNLRTVCTQAACPNRGECFSAGTATFLILGDRCTRHCGFCAVEGGQSGRSFDADEPARVAQAALNLSLRHVVVTSVTRDDLPDGGARCFADTVARIRESRLGATIEVLVPDFGGSPWAVRRALFSHPDVFGHNMETVPRLYADIRPGADYQRSLGLLRMAAEAAAASSSGTGDSRRTARLAVKTGLMLGLGEERHEVESVLQDCLEAGVDIVTLGQYLRPRGGATPVRRYVPPAEFERWRAWGEEHGLLIVAGPFVRSSYRAAAVLAQVAGSDAQPPRSLMK